MRSGRKRERGLSLAELLVAVTVLALAMTIALSLYDVARRAFRVGDNLAVQQQVVRIAFDLLGNDLRIAGLNHNPDGDELRPDEQIEAAWATAIVVRADFDGTDPVAAAAPEDTLSAGGAFRTVSTGNDEVIGYVLAKDDGTSTESLVFDVDVMPVPRDGAVESVTMDDVALTQDDPPYTLYRFRVSADGTGVVREPVIDDVRSLRFRYYDSAGAEIPPAGGDDDATGDARRARARIRRIGVELEGLTRDPDVRWVDENDPDPTTRSYRKFSINGQIVPLNLGHAGLKDLEAVGTVPSTPPPPTPYPGHCEGLWVTWAPNPPQDEIARYEIRYGTAPGSLTELAYSTDNTTYLDGLDPSATYWMTVEAVDDSGNPSLPSPMVDVTTENLNTPDTPTSVAATALTGPDEGKVVLDWSEVTTNTTGVPFPDPMTPTARDLVSYRIYRSPGTSFFEPASELVAEISVGAALTWTDALVPNCRDHAYVVRVADRCDLESADSSDVDARTAYSIPADVPTHVEAFEVVGGTLLRWDAVHNDTAGNPVVIDQYEVHRSAPAPPTATPGFLALKTVISGGVTEYLDIQVPADPSLVYHYAVKAFDDCGLYSVMSDTTAPTCPFAGTVRILDPAPNTEFTGNIDVTVEVQGGVGDHSLLLDYEELYGGPPAGDAVAGTGPSWTHTWSPGGSLPGPYRIHAIVTNASGCVQTAAVRVELGN